MELLTLILISNVLLLAMFWTWVPSLRWFLRQVYFISIDWLELRARAHSQNNDHLLQDIEVLRTAQPVKLLEAETQNELRRRRWHLAGLLERQSNEHLVGVDEISQENLGEV